MFMKSNVTLNMKLLQNRHFVFPGNITKDVGKDLNFFALLLLAVSMLQFSNKISTICFFESLMSGNSAQRRGP